MSKSFADLVEAARIEKGYSRANLATLIGVATQSIIIYEQGSCGSHPSIPPDDVRKLIVKVLGLSTKEVNAAMRETLRRRKERIRHRDDLYPNEMLIDDLRSRVSCCPCKNSTVSSAKALIKVCRVQFTDGNGRCKECAVWGSKGEDVDALKERNITIKEILL